MQQRTKIHLIEPDAAHAPRVISHGAYTLDLAKVQQVVDNRRNEELSWSQLSKAIGAGLTMHGRSASWRQFADSLINEMARANKAPLPFKLRNKIRNYMPVEGLADRVAQTLNLGDDYTAFREAMEDAEEASLEKGAQLHGKVQNGKAIDEEARGNGCDAPPLIASKSLLARIHTDGQVFWNNQQLNGACATTPYAAVHSIADRIREERAAQREATLGPLP